MRRVRLYSHMKAILRMMSEEDESLADEILPPTDVQHLMPTEVDRIEDELGEELEHFDFEFDEEFAAEECDEWDRPEHPIAQPLPASDVVVAPGSFAEVFFAEE